MKSIRPYVSLDLETTGLDLQKSQILQIGAVFDDGKSPIDKLQTLNILVDNETITYGESYAMGMNAWIFKELFDKNSKFEKQSLTIALQKLWLLLSEAAERAYEWDVANGKQSPRKNIQIAGKNVGSFDLAILANQGATVDQAGVTAPADHRTIDVGSMYFEDFGRNAGLNSINKLTGRDGVSHDALQDAFDVVTAIRHKLGGE